MKNISPNAKHHLPERPQHCHHISSSPSEKAIPRQTLIMLKVAMVLALVPIALGVNVMELALNGTLINLAQVQGAAPRLDINIQLNRNPDCGNTCASSNNMRDCSCMGSKLAKFPYGFNAVIKPDPNQDSFNVYCSVHNNKIWTVIQERIESNENEVGTFDRTYAEYENGFGTLNSNFWLGLKRVRMLTEAARMSMRMVVHNSAGFPFSAQYDVMQVSDAARKYALTVSGHTGNIGASIVTDSNTRPFSAKDQDNGAKGCPGIFKAGWWYANKNGTDCVTCTPNGVIDDTKADRLACDMNDGSKMNGRHTFIALAPKDYIEA